MMDKFCRHKKSGCSFVRMGLQSPFTSSQLRKTQAVRARKSKGIVISVRKETLLRVADWWCPEKMPIFRRVEILICKLMSNSFFFLDSILQVALCK